VRLNRFLSQCGLGSRRGSEQLILEGRVSINGHLVKDLGTKVEPSDQVNVDGKPVRAETGVVIALNKPRGYICSRSDERDRMTIYALLPKPLQTLHHVGRLDKDSEGLLLLTNRGDLSHHLIHPSKGAEKEYEVIVDKPMDQVTMAKLVKGMLTEEGYAKAERAWMVTEYRCHVVLKQGLKRQIRLMFYQLGFEVERLTRTRIGWLELKGLQKGGWKQLSSTEVERFFSQEGTTGRPPRIEKAKVAKAESEDDEEVIRPVRAKSTRERSKPERTPRGPGKGRAERRARPERESREERPAGRGRARPDREDREERPAGRGRARPDRESREERPAGRGRARPDGASRTKRDDRDAPTGRSSGGGRSRTERPRSSGRDEGSRSSFGKRPSSKRSGGGPSKFR
jgi:23S rRNA pseudouridine2605 synthase